MFRYNMNLYDVIMRSVKVCGFIVNFVRVCFNVFFIDEDYYFKVVVLN